MTMILNLHFGTHLITSSFVLIIVLFSTKRNLNSLKRPWNLLHLMLQWRGNVQQHALSQQLVIFPHNQVAYAFTQSRLMQPFKTLLRKKQPFFWDEALKKRLKIKRENRLSRQTRCVCVCVYDLRKTTCLATDWPKEGLGLSLPQ